MRASLPGLLVLTVAAACATASSSGAPAPASQAGATAAASRCAAVADSVRAVTAVADLPVAVPQGRPKLPIPRRIPAGEIHTTFLVDPTGRAVRGSVVTKGGGDHEYQSEMEDVVLRTKFRSPMVAGCPSWGRGDFRIRADMG